MRQHDYPDGHEDEGEERADVDQLRKLGERDEHRQRGDDEAGEDRRTDWRFPPPLAHLGEGRRSGRSRLIAKKTRLSSNKIIITVVKPTTARLR